MCVCVCERERQTEIEKETEVLSFKFAHIKFHVRFAPSLHILEFLFLRILTPPYVEFS